VVEAARVGLIDEHFGATPALFRSEVTKRARALAADPSLPDLLAEKCERRAADEAAAPLENYRAAEMERMRLNFYGFDASYHVARHHFVHKLPHSRTPLHLARHRRGAGALPLRQD
jgi:putative two-component system hydrogenase maturation factor HypX/HoxX